MHRFIDADAVPFDRVELLKRLNSAILFRIPSACAGREDDHETKQRNGWATKGSHYGRRL